MSRRFVPTDEQRYSVELMAGIGIPHDHIAAALDICAATLKSAFPDELRCGKTRTITKVADSLVRQALSGNITAAIFYLKTQGGWRDSAAVLPDGKKAVREQVARTAEQGTNWDGLLQ